MLRECHLQQINNQIDDIFLSEKRRISLNDLDDTDEVSERFATICLAIATKLHDYDNRVKIPIDSALTIIDIYAAIENLLPHFEVSATILKYRTINFLCTQLQAEIIASPATAAAAKTLFKETENRRKISSEFDKICRNLQIPRVENDSREETISRITCHLTGICNSIPESLLLNPPKILSNFAGSPGDQSLTAAQVGLVSKIEWALHEDFSIRREMLLKRFDVTIKSFSRPGKSEGQENEMLNTIKMKRDDFPDAPRKYTLVDALQAPISLLYESAKRVTDLGGHSKKVAYVNRDKVPDRGGRVNDLRPKAEKPNNKYKGKNGGGGGPRETQNTVSNNRPHGKNAGNRAAGKIDANETAVGNTGSQPADSNLNSQADAKKEGGNTNNGKKRKAHGNQGGKHKTKADAAGNIELEAGKSVSSISLDGPTSIAQEK